MASSDSESRAKSPLKKTKKAMTTAAITTNKVSTVNMVAEALRTCEDKNGMSLSALKRYLGVHYPETESHQGFNHRLKKAIQKGLESGAFIRSSKSKECTGASGSFKMAKSKPKATMAKKRSRSASPAVAKPRKRSRSLTASPAKKPKTGEKAKPKKVAKPKPRSKSPATGKTKLPAKAATDKKTAAKKSPGVSKKSAPMAKKTKGPKATPKSPVAKATKKPGIKK